MGDSDVILKRAADTDGLVRYVRNHLDEVLREFAEELLDEVARENGVDLDVALRARVLDRLNPRELDLAPGVAQRQVLAAISEARDEGRWGVLVDEFTEKHELRRLRGGQRRAVIRALKELRITPTNPNPAQEHTIARVYEEVVGTAGGTDPVQLTRPAGRITPWNFQVRPFEQSYADEPKTENILAAGALMWCFEIGERMGVYRVCDALVYRWWIGQADFSDPDLVAQLYRYYKLRDERLAEEERALLYRRVLGLGRVQTSDRMVVNEIFPELWRTLMEEVSAFIEKSESSFRDNVVSRQGIYQATRELQNNLGQYMVGMSQLQVAEMYNQLRAETATAGNLGALDILEHHEVVAQFGAGMDRNAGAVIRRMASEDFGAVPNVASIGTSADRGYEVFQWIADYRPGAVDDERFYALIDAGKAWILAQGAAGDGLNLVHEPDDEFDDDEFADEDNGEWEDER